MRTLTGFFAIAALMLGGCQSPYVKNSAEHLKQIMPKWDKGHTLHDYQGACLEKSKLGTPQMVGQIIDTPHYALITLQKTDPKPMGGELCIVNKVTHHVEVTAVNDLQFIEQNMPKP